MVRWCLAAGLGLTLSTASAQTDATTWEGQGLRFELRVATPSDLPSEQLAAGAMLLIGLVGTPVVALVEPLALPFMPIFIVVAPVLQSQFNAQSEALVQVFASESLGPLIVDAVRARWVAPRVDSVANAQMSIVGYGLATRSGRRLQALEPAEPLCLVAEARLDWQHEGEAPSSDRLLIGLHERSPDAPPPLCLPLSRWSEAKGLKLRQALRELGEVLGAMAAARVARRP